MKGQLMAVLLAATVLGACNMNDDATEAPDTNENVEQTRYKEDSGMTRDRNYNMGGNLERDTAQDNKKDMTGDKNQMGDNKPRYEVAEEAAKKITDNISNIDRAYVITTDNNAYVAAQLDNNTNQNNDKNQMNSNNQGNTEKKGTDDGQALTDDVKNQISDMVTSVDNSIDNVYVSTNPDFFDLTNNYVEDTENGRPIRGFFDQFGNMIERLFPQNK